MPAKAAPPPPSFPVPWGLFIVLALYAAGVYGYIWATYWNDPAYLAAGHYARALRLLGVTDGRDCSEAELVRGLEEVLHAARLMPEVKELAVHTENLRGRFVERKFTIPKDLARHAELVSVKARQIEQERKPWMVVGVRDRAWGPEQLLEGPRNAVLWSIPGGVIIILFWAYTRFSAKAVREREHEQDLKQVEQETEALGDYRRGLEQVKARPPPAAEDDDGEDGDTLANPPARPPSRPAVRAVSRPPSQAGVKAVSRPPTQPGVKAVSRPPSQAGVKAVSRPPTQPGVKAVSRPPSQPAVKAVSRPPTQPGAKAVSRPPSPSGEKPVTRPPSTTAIPTRKKPSG